MEADDRKPVEYELMEIGEVLGPVEIDIDQHFVRASAFTVDDYHEWHMGDSSPFGGPIAHGAALLCDLLRLLYTRYDPDRDRGLHLHEEFTLHSPVFVGERVRLTGRFVDKYVKRGRGYIVTEAEARTVDDDRLIVRHLATEATDIPADSTLADTPRDAAASRRVSGVFPTDREELRALSHEVRVGDPLRGPVKVIRQDQMSIYSGAQYFWKSIHTDREAAIESGMKDTVAQGLMEASYLSEWGTQLFGKSWFETGRVTMSFLGSIFPGDVVSLFAVVTEAQEVEGGTRIELETWVEDQEGSKAAVGWFSGVLERDAG